MVYPKSFFDDKQNKKVHSEESLSIFVVMPFSTQFRDVYNKGIKSLAGKMGFACVRADELFQSKPIMEDILRLIYKSKIIIADTTGRNPNVFYELGISHTTKEYVIIISQSLDDVPFDLRHLRCFLYSPSIDGIKNLQLVLFKALLEIYLEIILHYNNLLLQHISKARKIYKKLRQNDPNASLQESSLKAYKRYCDTINDIQNKVSLSTLSKSIKDLHKADSGLTRILARNTRQMELSTKKLEAKNAKEAARLAKIEENN